MNPPNTIASLPILRSMKKVVVLTGNEVRHQFFRKFLGLSANFQVISSYCEDAEPSRIIMGEKISKLRKNHLEARSQTELDFFGVFTEKAEDKSNPKVLPRGEINSKTIVDEIIHLDPDYLIGYGCSLVKEPLINAFPGRFINLHLGLSPYYRGSGTNFWPVVNQEPGFIGASFMYIDQGIDTGKIIHQIRANIHPWDTLHTLGNRLIRDAAYACESLIDSFEQLVPIPDDFFPEYDEKYYRNRDFTEDAVVNAYQNLEKGLLANYLKTKPDVEKKYPIFTNQGLKHLLS